MPERNRVDHLRAHPRTQSLHSETISPKLQVPSALTLSVTRCGTWPGEAMKLTTTRSSLSTTCRRSSESKLPAGCCHASVWWVLTSEKSRQTNCDIFETSRVLMCSLDLLKRHVGDEKKKMLLKKESHAKQNCKDRLLHQPSLWSCGVVRMLWISFFTHLSTRSTCSEI